MLSFVLAKVTVIYAYIYYASYALPRLPLSGLSKGLTCDVNMQLECSGKQVKQEVLNNVILQRTKTLFHIVEFRFREMLRNWSTVTVDITVIIYTLFFS